MSRYLRSKIKMEDEISLTLTPTLLAPSMKQLSRSVLWNKYLFLYDFQASCPNVRHKGKIQAVHRTRHTKKQKERKQGRAL